MKKLITLSLCIGVLILGVYTYNANINSDKITSLEQTNKLKDPITTILKENIKLKKQAEIFDINRLTKENEKRTEIQKEKIKQVSRGNNIQLIPIKVIATAYAPKNNISGICNDGSPNSTSTGTNPNWGTIAVDPKEIPYFSKLIIPTYNDGKVCTAEDTGGALRRDKNNIRIDLYMDTYEEAMKWGRQEIIIYIIK